MPTIEENPHKEVLKYGGAGYFTGPEIHLDAGKLPARFRGKESKLSVTQIHREGQPLVWVNVVNPTPEIIEKLAKKFGIKYADVSQALEHDRPPTSYRYRNYLVCHLDELRFDPVDTSAIKRASLSAILNDAFLITFADPNVESTRRVRNELREQDINPAEINSSNYLFSRILGSDLHFSSTAMAEFELQTEEFCERESISLPENRTQSHVRAVRKSIAQETHSLQRYGEIISALSEEQNLFGSNKARDALGRYRGMLGGATQSLEQTSKATDELRKTWKERIDEWRNDSLDRLTYLSAAVLIPSLAADILGIDYSGNNLPVSTISKVFLAAGILSAYLVGRVLVRKKTMQAGPDDLLKN